ncbi:hypothetical protein INT47_009947 [Mucor saturninus]|uniref:Uncharacterized protein n=1 Tax=Mucor saturninus TaxID=64648 RepID=A0A8H7V140_9FUNG|nr:hypothetical protein INT47_009947 [Mucor saturninus]
MAPILPPPTSLIRPESTGSYLKKNAILRKISKKKLLPVYDLTVKPLPQLIQDVMDAIDEEDKNLRKEEEVYLKEHESLRLNKPPAAAPPHLSPLDTTHPPLPPPKDIQDEPQSIPDKDAPSLAEKDSIRTVEEETMLTSLQEAERLSLEEDYPNRTIIDPSEIINTELRDKIYTPSSQWYFDEYSGLYRQNASLSHQSLPDFQNIKRTNSLVRSDPPNASGLKRASTAMKEDRPHSFALKLKFPELDDNQSVCSRKRSIFTTNDEEENWPTPTSVEQVHSLRKKANSMRDRRKNLDLCRTLMDAACQGAETAALSNDSPVTRTPSVSTRYRKQELRKKKKQDLVLDEVLVLEAQKILKKLAIGAVGHNTDGDAQFLLANCYGVGGLGLTLNRERAFSLYIHASKQNHVESTYRAGVCYEIGIGTTKDHARAIVYYRKAANLSHVASMYKMAVILLRGYCGQLINTREAITWLQRAAALANWQNPHALYVLAMFQFTEEFADDPALISDPSYALELLHQSAQLDHLPSQVKLGELYETGGGPVEPDDAISIYWYTKAAERGNADAALALSSWYLTGSVGILPQSDREAYLWAIKAASSQVADRWTIAKAYFLVGMYVERGIGISHTSAEDAKIWFKRSAALGHKGAVEMISKQDALSCPTVSI